MRYARIENGLVVEVVEPLVGENIAALYHPDFVAALVDATEDVDVGWTWDGTSFTEPAAPVVDLASYAADKRWRVETGGITVGGVSIATDDRSKLMLTGARTAAEANASFTTTWIAADGSAHELDATAVIAISNAVLAHVSGCFATYAVVSAAIAAGTITSIAEIDDADWPG